MSCEQKFTAKRADARYCSGRCRQRAARARDTLDDLDREIEQVRLRYWELVRRKAEATGAGQAMTLTGEAQLVDECGNVYMGGAGGGMGRGARLVGRQRPARDGWSVWGLEAAGPPFCPPPGGDGS